MLQLHVLHCSIHFIFLAWKQGITLGGLHFSICYIKMNLLLSLHQRYSSWILIANRNALQFQHVSLTTSLPVHDVQKAFLPPAPVQRSALLPMQVCKTINILCTKHTVIRNIYSGNENHQLFSEILLVLYQGIGLILTFFLDICTPWAAFPAWSM